MRPINCVARLLLWSLVLCQLSVGQEPPPGPTLSVGEIDLSTLRWGPQTTQFEVTNHTNEVRFVTVDATVRFSGRYLNPERRTRTHVIVKPLETQTVRAQVEVPTNFGQAQVAIELHDVVDTLDRLLPGQKFFEQPFTMTFHLPDELIAYFNDRIDVPPRLDRHPDFDNEFSRVTLALLQEGKGPEEIARLAHTDVSIVDGILHTMISRGYLKKEGDVYALTFPFISVPEAEAAKKVADDLARRLASDIERNMSGYPALLDSLIAAGRVDRDTNAFMGGGGVLHHRYPTVSALLLWLSLGQMFVTDTQPLLVFEGSDPCNARTPGFMYAVRGGDIFNGTHFFYLTLGPGGYYQIVFGDSLPTLDCGDDLSGPFRGMRLLPWGYLPELSPETFMLDTAITRPILRLLADGTKGQLEKAKTRLDKIATQYGHSEFIRAYRYWFWNLTATRTLKILVDKGVLVRRGNGLYKFDGLPAPKG
ncbi:MAG TPA: hypothetical protein VN285_13470 [Candidatus Deferrimicrobium sp.]|nr:hypothetical protein [Candidatus Deferrimicrobium sp.]